MSINISAHYSLEDLEAFGSRLHLNTALAVVFNSLAAYLILKHSTPVIGNYKYYMLSTVIFAFLMDFHITFIWGWYPLFPRLAMCPAGIVRHFGPFWGVTVQYALLHFTLSLCGLSVFSCLVYQYLSIVKRKSFLQTQRGGFIFAVLLFIYPLPSFFMHLPNINYDGVIKEIKETEPNLLPFFIAASCNGTPKSTHAFIYLSVVIVQILVVNIIALFLGYKIYRYFQELKEQMSNPTLKMRKQFFIVLVIQMAIPVLFMAMPSIFTGITVMLGIQNIDALSQTFVQTLTLHSVANSLTIIVFIKSYRQVLLKQFKYILCCWNNRTFPILQIPTNISLPNSSANISSFDTSK